MVFIQEDAQRVVEMDLVVSMPIRGWWASSDSPVWGANCVDKKIQWHLVRDVKGPQPQFISRDSDPHTSHSLLGPRSGKAVENIRVHRPWRW